MTELTLCASALPPERVAWLQEQPVQHRCLAAVPPDGAADHGEWQRHACLPTWSLLSTARFSITICGMAVHCCDIVGAALCHI